ncbi:subunit of the Arp2/3 complex [Puccinia graminis f. sp. tritici]|uniref:Subunit of the Arp2/3 complex n=1 Tax=Puccinia graminis f. sp. tritici TaxID=56615 RepID=A0A5B0PZX2_PUCGR|nr:subunit of the Arp2/3 complex [Puccinia graminis f. sp. tritici]
MKPVLRDRAKESGGVYVVCQSKIRGPAPPLANPSDMDIVDEALDLFKSNSLFRNFKIKGFADWVLIYLILFTSDCLHRISLLKPHQKNKNEASKQLLSYSLDNFFLPGKPGFPMNGIYAPPKDKIDAVSKLSARMCLAGHLEGGYPRISARIPSKAGGYPLADADAGADAAFPRKKQPDIRIRADIRMQSDHL